MVDKGSGVTDVFFPDWHQAEDYEYYINLIKTVKASWKIDQIT